MYILLHRALRNAGDHLIFQRARSLLAAWRPGVELEIAEAWRPLEDQLAEKSLATARAIVVCGGPGYGRGMDARYPLGDLRRLPPVVLLALGSAIVPGTGRQIEEFQFDAGSMKFLQTVSERSSYLGARDQLTADLLQRNGFDHVLMAGDPAWYDLPHLDDPVRVPADIASIAFTPPAGPAFFAQAAALFETVADQFNRAAIHVVHHRGVQRPFHALASRRGWRNIDITGSVDGFRTFDAVDLHLGYRVHAHLYAISHGTPTYLVAEDSRGTGVHQTLGRLGAIGFGTDWDDAVHRAALAQLPRLANSHRRPTSWLGMPVSRMLHAPDVADEITRGIERDIVDRFARHEAARATIRRNVSTMRTMIESLP